MDEKGINTASPKKQRRIERIIEDEHRIYDEIGNILTKLDRMRDRLIGVNYDKNKTPIPAGVNDDGETNGTIPPHLDSMAQVIESTLKRLDKIQNVLDELDENI